ncbi:MAG TPA: 6,7-dimethyl-8-ribityllumazine synthase [Terriglobia bacterium]|nr:6,7-dimethyl-8-ribityllumazine synthase [Terriglobia bacterium]
MRLREAQSKALVSNLARKDASRLRIAIIRGEYNREITLSLEKKCVDTLRDAGIPGRNLRMFAVPGCFEIPILAQRLAAQQKYDALIALGAVIKGDTYHFELVVNECARGIMDVSLRHDVPIVFEVLATYNKRDAERRAGNNKFNKGIEAAQTALSLLAALSSVRG